jgi:TonB family protein
MIKRRLAIVLIGMFALPAAVADEPAQLLDKLYQDAQRGLQETQAVDQQREKRFTAARDAQLAKLHEAEEMLAKERRRGEQLKNTFAANKPKLNRLHDQLESRSADLSAFFGAVRRAAGETVGVLHQSVISAQYPDRDRVADKLADSGTLPSVQQVEQLWQLMLQEISESGRVTRFRAPVQISAQFAAQMTVTRVGAFDLVADGCYLRYAPDEHKLSTLGRQLALIRDPQVLALETAAGGYHRIGIDPTAGARLGVIMEARDFADAVSQGHVVGFLSMGLGLVGLLAPIRVKFPRLIGSLVGAALFSFGIALLMTSMFNVFFGNVTLPTTYAEMQIVRQVPEKTATSSKQQTLPEMKPHPQILPLPPRLALQQANLLPSVPSLMSLPKLSTDLHMAGSPLLGRIAFAAKPALDNEVIPLVQVPPMYPARAQRLHIGGSVIVEFTINEVGRVENPSIVKSEPPKIFDQSAIQAILNWRFKPKLEGGKPVSRLARQRFDFTPRD